MAKNPIERDEWWPVYIPGPDAPADLVARFHAAQKAFQSVQDELEALWEQLEPDPKPMLPCGNCGYATPDQGPFEGMTSCPQCRVACMPPSSKPLNCS